MSESTATRLVDLFERATAEEVREPDYTLHLEITERMNQRRRYMAEGIEYFKQLLKSSDLKTINLTLAVTATQLIDTCLKNCNINFHRYANNRGLVPPLATLLKRKRKKLNVLDKMTGLYKEAGWRAVEDKVLGMMQLWADTFMMQEDKFPVFMSTYRELRKEGLKFPPRDPNERYMIKYEGEASPAFELAEMEGRGVEPGGVIPGARPESVSRPVLPSRLSQPADEDPGEEPKLLPSDIETIQTIFPIFEESLRTVRALKDLQADESRSLARTCRKMQKKLMLVVSFKAGNGIGEKDTVDMLEILDYVNARMEAYKRIVTAVKAGGNNGDVQAILIDLTSKERREEKPVSGLLDLGDDFLEVPEVNPLDKLASLSLTQDTPKPATREESKQPAPDTSPTMVKRLAPPPGMAAAPISDFEFFEDTVQVQGGKDEFSLANVAFEKQAGRRLQEAPQVEEDDFFSDLANRRL